jgi:hypothetical protein
LRLVYSRSESSDLARELFALPIKSLALKVLSVGILSLFFIGVTGCETGGSIVGGEPRQQIRGQVVEVIGRDILEIESFLVRDANARIWTFTTEGPVEFTPSHLREHQMFGQTVIVTYISRSGVLFAVELRD